MGEPWFGVKEYGFGISPKGTAGWVATVVFVLAMAATPSLVAALHGPHWTIYAGFAALGVIFLALMAAKSDGRLWRWRWGGK